METITVVSKLLYHSGVNLLSTQNNVLVDRNYVTNELIGIPYWVEPGANDAEYKQGDLVQHNGKLYKCLTSFTDARPDADGTTDWVPTKLRTRNTGVIDLAESASTNTVEINHGLNSKNLFVQVYTVENGVPSLVSSGYSVTYVDFNTIRITATGGFANTYRVLITSLD